MHKFLRDGRKLICRKCGAEHATLDAVLGCYDGHPATMKAEAGPDQSHKYMRDGAKYVCRGCGKKHFGMAEVVVCYDGHPPKAAGGAGAKAASGTEGNAASPAAAAATGSATVDAAAGAAPAATAAVPAPGPMAKPSATEDADKFYRDGARYVCRSCNTKYFTRGDVIACFEKH
jgi:ribosomal protein L40E